MVDDPTKVSQSPLEAWIGQSCTSIYKWEIPWVFEFGNAGTLTIECPWRIIAKGRIALAGDDDGHQFGLPEPLDGEARARELLVGKQVTAVRIDPVSADLRIVFGENAILELFSNSAGYEGWSAVAVHDGTRTNVIALGGGATHTFDDPEVRSRH